ncbi:MAG: bacillithiol biosynthesis deacetylase BshB1 [Ignavibacteria bacterium]|nr:bacillithiol biosynthesis deacetylase BshB1 [Ignavibacteria bacterium]
MKKLDVIIFAAHPDDAEINCGGTILSLTAVGKNVGIVDLTLGELSTRGNLKLRKKETDTASELLKLSFRTNLKISDGNIEINKINKEKIIRVIREYRPKIVFAPYPHDRHPDHINASNLIRESFFYSGLSKIKTGNLESYRPKNIYYYRNAVDIPISFIFDISKTFQKKLEVLKCYRSQFYNSDSKEPQTFISSKLFDNEVEARARHFGFKIGVEFGEPYYSHNAIKVNDESLFKI